MREWLRSNAEAPTWGEGNYTWLDEIEWPTEKPPALVTIDDRALTFSGNWADYSFDMIKAFKPWNKRENKREKRHWLFRSAITGRFVSRIFALFNPSTTVRERKD